MNRVNKLRLAYQHYISARHARFDEIINSSEYINRDDTVQSFSCTQEVAKQLDKEERESIDESGNHDIGVPTRGR